MSFIVLRISLEIFALTTTNITKFERFFFGALLLFEANRIFTKNNYILII